MLENYVNVKNEIFVSPSKAKSTNIIKFEFENYEEFQKTYKKAMASKVKSFMEYKETDYGKSEFGILDTEGNMIIISYAH